MLEGNLFRLLMTAGLMSVVVGTSPVSDSAI